MSDRRPRTDESGLLFSPQPAEPGLQGQRHVDSALFDLRQLDAAAAPGTEDAAGDRTREAAGSGLIDVKSLVEANGEAPRVPVMPPGGLLIGLSPPPTIQPAPDRTARKLLIASCIALVAIIAMLAYEALR